MLSAKPEHQYSAKLADADLSKDASAGTQVGNAALPVHIAIIMDGNGRWAKSRFLPRAAGHRQGAEAVRATVKACGELGIRYLTLFAFSSDNWKRPRDEIDHLMGLLRRYIRQELAELHQQGVRIRIIGNRQALAPDIIALIDDAEARTIANTRLNLIIAVNYGGQDDMVQAAQRMAADVARGQLRVEDITRDSLAARLETAGMPDPDLVIRTSGEKRLSNFLLWQSAYAELVFVPTAWPDFGKSDLILAVDEFRLRQRRFGGTCA